jgi:hypothetical protein
MSQTPKAVITIRRPANSFVGSSRALIVWIDGRRAGKVRLGVPVEFTVEPGEHTLAVSMDWVRSRPFPIAVGQGSRTELAVGSQSGWAWALKQFLPMTLIFFATIAIIEGLRATTPFIDENRLVRFPVMLAVFAALFGGYLLVTLWFGGDYWALYTLGPAEVGSSK